MLQLKVEIENEVQKPETLNLKSNESLAFDENLAHCHIFKLNVRF